MPVIQVHDESLAIAIAPLSFSAFNPGACPFLREPLQYLRRQ